MKVILSSNIDHYKYTAYALQKEKISSLFICSTFYKKKPIFYKYSGKYRKWIENRIDERLDFDSVRTFKVYEFIYKLIRNNSKLVFLSPDIIDKYFNKLFDYYTFLSLIKYNNIKIFHYVSGIGKISAKNIKKRNNAIIIVDDRAEHKEYLYNILKEEYISLGKTFNDNDFWKVDTRDEYLIADYIITPSQFSKETFIKQGIDESKLVVIPYGCNINNFYPLQISEEAKGKKFRIIYVGSLCLRKGIHYLLEAFESIDNPLIELLIIGKIEASIEDIIDIDKKNINYIPYIPNKELNYYLSLADVFILPSLSDSFSLATLEAMAAGLPVIVTENVGAKDFVNNMENGLVIPIKDSQAISDAILKLYNNPSLRNSMSKCARETALSITWDSYEEKVIEFYNQVVFKEGGNK